MLKYFNRSCISSISFVCIAILVVFLSGCSNSILLKNKTEYTYIPESLLVPVLIPHIPNEPINIRAALNLGSELRISACKLRLQVRELIRHSTGGNIVIERSSVQSCPD